MKLDYARKIKHIPLTCSLKSCNGVLTGVRNKHYYIQYDNSFYTVPKHIYLLLTGKRVVSNTYENDNYRLICYNGVDEMPVSIYNALVTAFETGAYPSKWYREVFSLILDGCLNINAFLYSIDSDKLVKEPLMEITDLEGNDKNKEWLNILS